MTNILHLINYPGQGGSERYIFSLANKLHGKACRFFLAHGMEGPLVSQMQNLGVETFLVPMKCPWDIKAARKLKQYCKEKNISIIHTHFLRENYVSILSKALGNPVRLVNTVHMMDEKTGITKAINGLATHFDNKIIVVSKAVKRIQENEGIKAHKLELIYNGVEIHSPEYISPSFRERLGISPEVFLITSVARFTEEKGHLFLLESLKIFYDELRDNPVSPIEKVRFVLAGEGPLMESCKEKASELGIDELLIFTGYCSDVTGLLHESDLFISHSMSEALGISILEALACGLPVVATDSGGPSEIINEETECGVLIDKQDAHGFARAILKMLSNREFYDSCSKRAKIVVEERFSLERMANETLRVYQEILPENL